MDLEKNNENIKQCRIMLCETAMKEMELEEELKNLEAGLIVRGEVQGSNEKQREANLRTTTADIRARLLQAKHDRILAHMSVEICLDERRLYENIMRKGEVGL